MLESYFFYHKNRFPYRIPYDLSTFYLKWEPKDQNTMSLSKAWQRPRTGRILPRQSDQIKKIVKNRGKMHLTPVAQKVEHLPLS